ncbi:MAG: GntR family transcriptional regulator, partial [Chloroflexota bacterium]|nr:GntR family transcriptional regulator [Chloroflexota bacterium]
MSNLKPITHIGLSGSVREAIEAAIVECELAPGTPLVDRQLASLLNVSRTPIRDAIRQLEPLGLVRRQGRGGMSGWVVAEFRERDVRELFELRRVLEPLGLGRLDGHWDKATANRLAAYFDDFPRHLERDQYEAYIVRDRAFHKEIVTLSGNSRVIGFYEIMEKQIDRIRHFLATGYEGRMDGITKEHHALCSAIAAHDIPGAIAALVHHLH